MRHYEHSGAVPILGVFIALVVALALSVLGVLYTYLIAWIPLMYISFLVTAGFGALVGVAVGWAARVGKIRNALVVGVLAALAVVPAYYASWMFDPLARFGLADGFILVSPSAVQAWMSLLYDKGGWGIASIETVKGPMLAAVWLIEAGLIWGVSVLSAVAMVKDRSFCEMCGRWTDTQKGLEPLSLAEADPKALERCAAGQLDGLCGMPIAADSENEFLRLNLACCPTCKECNVLSIELVQMDTDKQGKVVTKTLTLAKNLSITDADVGLLRTAGRPRSETELKQLKNQFDFLDDHSADPPAEE